MRSRPVYWTAIVILLLPLALFWIGIVTQSETMSRWLFGASRSAFRDLMPTVVLPMIALWLSVARLRTSGIPEAERNITRAVVSLLAFSFLLMFGYMLTERLR